MKGISVAIIISLISAILIFGVWYCLLYPSGTPNGIADQQVIRQAIQRYAGSQELYVTPKQITIPPLDPTGYPSFSYYGVTFNVPWTSAPLISTSSPNDLLTFLEFVNDRKLVEVFASSTSISPFVSGALSSYLSGVGENGSNTSAAFEGLYGPALQSNLNFIGSSLRSSPDQLSLNEAGTPASLLTATGLLMTKDNIFRYLGADLLPVQSITAIYTFSSSSTRGFEFVGSVRAGTTTHSIAHFLFFDRQDRPFNLLTEDANQSEDDFILSNMRIE